MKKKVNIASVKENADNPRFIKDSKFKKLVKSIKAFPEMLEKRPIVVDENMIVRLLRFCLSLPVGRDYASAQILILWSA